MNNLNIHKRLKEARIYLKLNQLQIATELNIQQKTISEIENGKILNIPNTYVYYFYKKGISLNWIFDNRGLMTETTLEDKNNNKKEPDLVETLLDFSDEKQKLLISNDKPIKETPNNYINKKELLDSKDFSITSLLSYIKSQENMIKFLQRIIEKNLNL